MVRKTRPMTVIRVCPRTTMNHLSKKSHPLRKRLNEQGKNSNLLITKPAKTLQLTEHVGLAIDGELASLADKIMREKADEDNIMELKKQHETPENCASLSERKVNQGVWSKLDESARSTDLKFQKV